ncbi:MAG: efflux RND transporter periplasmic adaptor subunit [Parcubacteria group bacterium]|nr:efflux RND transporter periplasmic adaptor subunit [Parcubacteria group bacterium]
MKYLKNKFVVGGIVILVVIIAIVALRSRGGKTALETTKSVTATVTEMVSVTGKVAPFQKADTGFEKGGIVSSIPVKVGDHVYRGQLIASLEDNQTLASLAGAKANLAVAEANLEDSLTDTGIAYVSAKKNLTDAIRSSYSNIRDIILNQTDTFFNNATSANPTININTSTYNVSKNVENQRILVGEALNQWKIDLDSNVFGENVAMQISRVDNYLSTVKTFLSTLSSIVFDVSRSSNLPQSTIDSYLSTINTANVDLSSSLSVITSAENSLDSATPKSTNALKAKVEQAKADVLNYQAQYNKSILTAPFSGIVTRIDPQVGDLVSAGQASFSVIGDELFKVEVNVPETDITRIAIGNKSSITLDAYGDGVVFLASVVLIDPAETIVEGVPTYKITLQFDKKDDRVRSGMTANVDIVTASKSNVVAIPFRAVIDVEGQAFVRIPNSDRKTFKEIPVVIGLKGSSGLVEIVSGLLTDTEVVTFAK